MTRQAPVAPAGRRFRKTKLILPALWLLLAMGGCGSDSPTSSPRIDSAARDIAPARAVLEWWARLSEEDPGAVLAGLTPAARRRLDERRLRAAQAKGLARWARASVPTVLYLEREGGGVTVYLQIESGDLVGERVLKRGIILLALPLVRRSEGWLIASSAWLDGQLDGYIDRTGTAPDDAEPGEP